MRTMVVLSGKKIDTTILNDGEAETKFLKDLPDKLKESLKQAITSFNDLLEGDILMIRYSKECVIVSAVGKPNMILRDASSSNQVKEDLQEALDLLLWCLGPHFHGGGNNATRAMCIEFMCSNAPGQNGRCSNPNCPSHEKWEIIDSKHVR